LSASASSSVGILACPSLELIEALYARTMLELLRQGPIEESARFTLAMVGHMCFSVGSTTSHLYIGAMSHYECLAWSTSVQVHVSLHVNLTRTQTETVPGSACLLKSWKGGEWSSGWFLRQMYGRCVFVSPL
jgi:hypothetical protein